MKKCSLLFLFSLLLPFTTRITSYNVCYTKLLRVTGKFEQDILERKLYLARKQAENEVRASQLSEKESFYLPSLSTKIFIYKGMLTPQQLGQYFIDLQDHRVKSAISLVHSRFSTNTFPTWDLAQPFSYNFV